MAEVGRPTELNDELCLEIRGLILDGKDYQEIRELLSIPKGTWDNWHASNYQAFAERLAQFKRDKRLMKSEQNIDEILEMGVEQPIVTMIGVLRDEKGDVLTKINPNLLRIKADTSKFVAETLGKDSYSKRIESTGKGGKDLPPPQQTVINIVRPHGIDLPAIAETIPSVDLPDGPGNE